MPYNTQVLLTDAKGNPIPQFFDVTTDSFKPIPDPTQVVLKESNAVKAVTVVPNDAIDLPDGLTKGVYIGVTGDIVVTMANGTDATFKALASGIIHPISAKRVKATGTTATSILAVY